MLERSLKRAWLWLDLNPKWVGISLACATIIGLLNFSAIYTLNRSYGLGVNIPARLFDELSGAWSILVPLPFLLKLFSLWPLRKANWRQRLPGYLAAMIAMGLLHTTVMTVMRYPLYPVLGLGSHDPGDLFFRYLMETAKASPVFWFFYVGHLAYWRNKDKQQESLRLAALQRELVEARLDSLKSQLNPHFLFNTLNLISSVMYDDLKKADSLLADLSAFLRYSLAFREAHEVTVAEEEEITRKYLDIMGGRFGARLRATLDIEASLRAERMPVFCLQPLVENAIKFAADRAETDAEISVTGRRDGDRAVFRVSDNGPGLGGSTNGTQIGLRNIRERIAMLYGDAASLELRDRENGGAEAVIKIPLRKRSEPERLEAVP